MVISSEPYFLADVFRYYFPDSVPCCHSLGHVGITHSLGAKKVNYFDLWWGRDIEALKDVVPNLLSKREIHKHMLHGFLGFAVEITPMWPVNTSFSQIVAGSTFPCINTQVKKFILGWLRGSQTCFNTDVVWLEACYDWREENPCLALWIPVLPHSHLSVKHLWTGTNPVNTYSRRVFWLHICLGTRGISQVHHFLESSHVKVSTRVRTPCWVSQLLISLIASFFLKCNCPITLSCQSIIFFTLPRMWYKNFWKNSIPWW